jgi:GT2 family glycosyltransferase
MGAGYASWDRGRSVTLGGAVHVRVGGDVGGTLTSLMSTVDGLDARATGHELAPTGPVSPGAQTGGAGDAEPTEAPALYPPVVAVVVTRNPGPWFETTLEGMAAQDYPDLHVLVVDCGSDDDPAGRVAAHLPRAFVRRLDATAGFAAAANEALRAVEGATFLLLMHDDVAPDPTAIRVLVEEAYRSNAGIVGPKLVSADDPDVLLEVGRAVDRFGAPYIGIEPGEVDQEQHDGVRDVFYVTTAMMLVRVDLFTELGGLDPATFPGAEDLDLCWRGRLAGARVIVAPDARVAHREAAEQRRQADRPDEIALARSRIRVLFTSYSLHTLLWLVPVGIVVGFVEAVGDLVTGHPRRARASISGWFSNLFHVRRLRASRRRAQAHRSVRDRELRELQVGSVARLSAFFAHHLQTDDRLRAISDRGRTAVGTVSDGLRTPGALLFVGFVVLVLVGSRDLISSAVPGIGTLVPWPGVGDLFDAFGSAWRYTGLGSMSAAPPLLALMGSLGTLLFGSVGLARTVVVVAALPVGAFGTYRFTRRIVGLRGPAFAAALAYGVNPVARNAIATGRFGPLVLFMLLPFALGRIVRLSGLDRDVAIEATPDVPQAVPARSPDGSPEDDVLATVPTNDALATVPTNDAPRGDTASAGAPRQRGRFLRLVFVVTLAAACYPVAPALFTVAAAAFLVAALIARGIGPALRAVGVAVAAAVGAAVLLFPWPLAYVSSHLDAASLGFAFRPDLSLGEVLRFDSGPSGAGWAMWGLVIAAVAPLFLATGARLSWAARGWMLAVVGWAIVWVPEQVAPDRSMLAPEAGLSLAAFGLALSLGVGASVLVDGIRTFRFGWRQPAALLGGLALLLPIASFTVDVADGRWHAPRSGWVDTLSFTDALSAKGQFRILWLGDPSVLPLDPVVLDDGTGYTLTRNSPGNASQLLRAPQDDSDQVVDRAVELARNGLTNRLGRLLAPAGVRWIALPSTEGPGSSEPPARLPGWRRALDAQLDLARLRSARGLVLYENLAWIPLRAVVPQDAAAGVPVGVQDATRAALGADAVAATPVPSSGAVVPGLLLWGEAYDREWGATAASGGTLDHVRTFGWSNGYRVERRSEVDIAFGAQWQRWALLGGALVIWLVVLWRWWRTRTRTSRAQVATAARDRRRRRERSARPDTLDDAVGDEEFWWERV